MQQKSDYLWIILCDEIMEFFAAEDEMKKKETEEEEFLPFLNIKVILFL